MAPGAMATTPAAPAQRPVRPKPAVTPLPGATRAGPGASFALNAYGLHDMHDMHGNVWEWVADRYDESYYARSPVDDPQGPEVGGCGAAALGTAGRSVPAAATATGTTR